MRTRYVWRKAAYWANEALSEVVERLDHWVLQGNLQRHRPEPLDSGSPRHVQEAWCLNCMEHWPCAAWEHWADVQALKNSRKL